MGEPGVGKSRLFHEFKILSPSGCLVLETFSVSHSKAYPYLPLIDLLKTYLCNAPAAIPHVRLVRTSAMRWPIETCFETGKQELGMGDYEIRSWRGWHHHMTLVMLAHFFVVRMSLRLKKSPSSDAAPSRDGVGDRLAPPRV